MALDGNSIEVIDNFLSEEDFKQVTNIINNDMFPWYFNGAVADVQDTDNFYFTHIFCKDSKVESPNFNNALIPLLKKLPHGNLYRAKANLFVRQNEQIINGIQDPMKSIQAQTKGMQGTDLHKAKAQKRDETGKNKKSHFLAQKVHFGAILGQKQR